MPNPNILVLFYSTYGTNHTIAEAAVAAAEEAGGILRLRKIPETAPEEVIAGQDPWKAQIERASGIDAVSHDDLDWADGIWLSAPTRFGGQSSQVRAWIDTLGPLWQKGALLNKVVTATTSAQNPNGGVEQTLMNFYHAAIHWGAIIAAPGYGDTSKFADGGNPYGFSKGAGDLTDEHKASIAYQARRLVEIAGKIGG